MKTMTICAAATMLALMMSGCGVKKTGTLVIPLNTTTNVSQTEGGKLVVYSSRKEKFVKPLVEAFEKETGVKVSLLSQANIVRLDAEKKNPQADIFFSNDAGQMEHLRLDGLLEGNDSAALDVIDSRFRAADGSWVGLSARSRIFMYNKDKISESDMPKTLKELADPKWKGTFMITRGGNGSMIAHVAALRAAWGDDATRAWLKAIKENAGAITSGHTDIRRGVGAGKFAFGLVNNYYFHLQLAEPEMNNVAAVYPDQAEGETGIFVNAAGVALVKGGPNTTQARAFVDWLLEAEQQASFSYLSKETPLREDIRTIEDARKISDYRTMSMPLHKLGPVWADTKALIAESGLDLELN